MHNFIPSLSPSSYIELNKENLSLKHKIYLTILDESFGVCKRGFYVISINTVIETDDPQSEIIPALRLLNFPNHIYYKDYEYLEPLANHIPNLYITKSYDSTVDLESVAEDIIYLYEQITGENLDLT